MLIISRTMKETMLFVLPFVFLLGLPCTFADDFGTTTSVTEPPVCDPKCGCDGIYIYDEVKADCVVNLPKLMKTVEKNYDSQDDEAILAEEGMARSIYIEGQQLFRGIMIAVMFFMTCAAICVLSACIYCCRIDYTDRKLRNEVKALAKKMHRKYDPPKQSLKPKAPEPKSQNCNVFVEEAGVFVV
ncbi:uncharacterized protein LOC142980621 [Anticarsia gemmatalis]|uniref:uncharacterized protein LOC142980621 n=1 Tax=Anticarsia gemmatalis TaxID=129554 RepID=UPI003F771701